MDNRVMTFFERFRGTGGYKRIEKEEVQDAIRTQAWRRGRMRLYRLSHADGRVFEYPSEYFQQRPELGDALMCAYRSEGFVWEVAFDFLMHPGSERFARVA